MGFKLCVTSLVLSLLVFLQVYAGEWVEVDSKWYYEDNDGVPLSGKFMDDAGDVYLADSSGACIVGVVNGEQYGNDCCLIVTSDNPEFEDLAIKFAMGEQISLKGQSQFRPFIHYYQNQVSMEGQGKRFTAWYRTGEAGSLIWLQNNSSVDRDALLRKLSAKVGAVSGITTREFIKNAAKSISSNFSYNLNSRLCSFGEFLETGQGVCWHYARALEEYLQYNNIKAQVIVGERDGELHSWVRAFDGTRWVYCDPTCIENGGDIFADIPDEMYLSQYRVTSNSTRVASR